MFDSRGWGCAANRKRSRTIGLHPWRKFRIVKIGQRKIVRFFFLILFPWNAERLVHLQTRLSHVNRPTVSVPTTRGHPSSVFASRLKSFSLLDGRLTNKLLASSPTRLLFWKRRQTACGLRTRHHRRMHTFRCINSVVVPTSKKSSKHLAYAS